MRNTFRPYWKAMRPRLSVTTQSSEFCRSHTLEVQVRQSALDPYQKVMKYVNMTAMQSILRVSLLARQPATCFGYVHPFAKVA